MHYLVHDHTKTGKVFATLEEANAYRNFLIQKTKLSRMHVLTCI